MRWGGEDRGITLEAAEAHPTGAKPAEGVKLDYGKDHISNSSRSSTISGSSCVGIFPGMCTAE